MKKDKKKNQNTELVLGKKIRDVKLSEKQHFVFFVTMIIMFNVLLFSSVWFVLISLNKWYNCLICIAILAISFSVSFKYYRDTKIFNKCALYNNAIVIDSIWLNLKIEFKDIVEINVKDSCLDKIFKLGTKSLEVKLINNSRHKFTIHFVEENAVKLKQEITMLIDKYEKENQSKVQQEKTSV